MDITNPLVNAPFGVASPLEIPEGSLQGQVGANMVGAKVNSVINALKAVPQAIEGSGQDIQHLGEQGYQKQSVGPTWDVTQGMAQAARPFAKKSSAGMFGGRLGASPQELERSFKAEDMLDQGKHPDAIWRETNWMKDPVSQKWMTEIPDDKSRMLYFPAHGPASAIMQHPDVVSRYPQFHGVKLKGFQEDRPSGLWNPNENTMYVTAPNKDMGRYVGLHEMQHVIQDHEKFPGGGDPGYIAQLLQQNKPQWLASSHQPGADDLPYQIYRNLAGEVQARNVQRRMNYPPSMRQQLPPWSTQQVPYDQQYNWGPAGDIVKALQK